jgi:hypothetical protein
MVLGSNLQESFISLGSNVLGWLNVRALSKREKHLAAKYLESGAFSPWEQVDN